MVKRIRLIILLFSILDAFLITYMLLFERDKYIYGRFNLNLDVFIVNILAILAVNAVVVLVIFLCRKSIKRLIAFLVPICLICAYCLTIVLTFTSSGAFWSSETDDYSRFNMVDPYLDKLVLIAGLKLSDITDLETENVEDFYYQYQSQVGREKFVFSGKFHLSNKCYESVKETFSGAREFENVILPPKEQVELGVTGYYTFDFDTPQYESSTTVDEWDNVYVGFNDLEQCIYFNLHGYCYT